MARESKRRVIFSREKAILLWEARAGEGQSNFLDGERNRFLRSVSTGWSLLMSLGDTVGLERTTDMKI